MSTGFYELENERLLRENAELRANNARLREAYDPFVEMWRDAYDPDDMTDVDLGNKLYWLDRIIAESPAASLEAIRAEATLMYRKRIHNVERHNQYFERCESQWCNPISPLAAAGPDLPLPMPGDLYASEREKAIRAELREALAESKRREAELRGSLKALRFGLGELGSY